MTDRHVTLSSDTKSEGTVEYGAIRTLAVVSGKGGSGKTMFISCLARILDDQGVPATLVDTDIGTGGLSYYLSVNYAGGIAAGLSELVLADDPEFPDARRLDKVFSGGFDKKLSGFSRSRFISVGDHRRLLRYHGEDAFRHRVGSVLNSLKKGTRGFLLLDCRGGADQESLEVCRVADDIIILAETDPASFQTTQHLVDVLSDADLGHRVRGFVVNRVFDDPSVIVRQGVHSFRSAFLGAIPFDLNSLRSFNVGEIPEEGSIFYRHVHGALSKLYPDIAPNTLSVWSFSDYKYANVDDPAAAVGGRLMSLVAFVFLLILAYATVDERLMLLIANPLYMFPIVLTLTAVLFANGTTDLRRGVGLFAQGYARLLQRLFFGRKKRH